MGEVKRLIVELSGDVEGNSLSNTRVKCEQTGNWLVILTMLTKAMSMAVEDHNKQIIEASQQRIQQPTDAEIKLAERFKS